MRTRRPRPAPQPRSAFAGFRFPPDIIVLGVRWHLRFGLSYRDVEELLAERGVEVDHVTVYRWVLRFTPLLALFSAHGRIVAAQRAVAARRHTHSCRQPPYVRNAELAEAARPCRHRVGARWLVDETYVKVAG
jgi:IS6 family transposase